MFGVGDTALALGALEDALKRGEPIAINHSFIDPMFVPVRQSKRFTAVVQGYGLDPTIFNRVKQ